MELLPTPFRQTPQGHLPESLVTHTPTSHFIIFVLSIFTLIPLASKFSFQPLTLSISSFSDSATNTRSSANRSSYGRPSRNLLDSASMTIMNSNGLRTEPWCTPTFTSNGLLSPCLVFTAVVESVYIDFITVMSHSSTCNSLNAHHRTSRGTLSNAFSRSTNAIHSSLFTPRYLSCNCRTMNIASVVPFP